MARQTVYVALLRGINVGGNNMVSMKALKASFERLGFQDVGTYINSGNVLFRTAETDARALENDIDRMLAREYRLNGKTVVRSRAEMDRLVKTISKTWKPDPAWRYNVIFLRHAIDSKKILAGIDVKPDIERVVYCPGTLLWSARVDALTRTAMRKLGSKPIYQDITVRNVNTTTKLLSLMQQMEDQEKVATGPDVKAPTGPELRRLLGRAYSAYEALTAEREGTSAEWRRYSKNTPWVLKVCRGERTLFYVKPQSRSFEVTVLLGPRATEAALAGAVAPRLHAAIRAARPYAEGRPVRVTVASPRDLRGVEQLVAVKLAPTR